jgi:formimidoylglutamate deiminase
MEHRNPFEELRLLDYGQRLTSHHRDTFIGRSDSSAENAFQMAATAGMNGTGEDSKLPFAIGKRLNACLVSDDHPFVSGAVSSSTADRILYAAETQEVTGTIVSGNLIPREKAPKGNLIGYFDATLSRLFRT